MYNDHSIGVVVTAYNEEGFVGEVIESMPPFVDRVYVVDDGSTDGTWEEITAHAQRINDRHDGDPPVTGTGVELSPRIVPIRRERNGGVGAAMKTGYMRAVRDGIDVTASMDGDGQMAPEELSRIIDPVVEGRADYAKGNRLWYRESRADMSRWRLFGNGLLTFFTKLSSGYWNMSDPQNGYTAISRDALETIPIGKLTDEYGFLNDLLTLLNAYEMRIADVQHRARYAEERSHINYSTFVPRLSALLARNFLWRLKTKYLVFGFHPLVLCYLLGTLTVGVSLAYGTYTAAGLLDGAELFVRGSITLIVFLIGALFLILGITFDIDQSGHRVVQIHHPAREHPGEIPAGPPALREAGHDEQRSVVLGPDEAPSRGRPHASVDGSGDGD